MKIVQSRKDRLDILSNLARSTGDRIGIEMKPFDFAAMADRSEEIHWMYRFDEHRIRIFRVQSGSQLFRDIQIERDDAINVDEIADQIEQIVTELEGRHSK